MAVASGTKIIGAVSDSGRFGSNAWALSTHG